MVVVWEAKIKQINTELGSEFWLYGQDRLLLDDICSERLMTKGEDTEGRNPCRKNTNGKILSQRGELRLVEAESKPVFLELGREGEPGSEMRKHNSCVRSSVVWNSSPQLFWHQGLVLWKIIFHGLGIWGMVSGLPAAHLLLCDSVPNRPQIDTNPWTKGWGP